MLNIHSSSGKNTMVNSKINLVNNNYATLLLGVTILTSLDENDINSLSSKIVEAIEKSTSGTVRS